MNTEKPCIIVGDEATRTARKVEVSGVKQEGDEGLI